MSGRVPGGHGWPVPLPGVVIGPGLTVVGDCVLGVLGVVVDGAPGDEGVLAPLPPLLPGVLPGLLPGDVDGDCVDGVVEVCPAAVPERGVVGLDDGVDGDVDGVDADGRCVVVGGSVCGVLPVGSAGVVDVTGTHGANGAPVGCCGCVDGEELGVDGDGLCVEGLCVEGPCVEGLCVDGLCVDGLGDDEDGDAGEPLF